MVLRVGVLPVEIVRATRSELVLVHAQSVAACALTQDLPDVEHELCLTGIQLLYFVVVDVGVYEAIAVPLEVYLEILVHLLLWLVH